MASHLLGIALLVVAAVNVPGVLTHDGPAGAFFFESFREGWQNRWQYSAFKKYKGRFSTVQPEGFQDQAIQASASSFSHINH